LKHLKNILYLQYIPYLIDIEIFSIYKLNVIKYWEDLIIIFVFTLFHINMDICIVKK
jgi:hypothetical protein